MNAVAEWHLALASLRCFGAKRGGKLGFYAKSYKWELALVASTRFGGGELVANIRLSLIVPAYNAGRYIVQCLRSLLEEHRDDFEVVVINDGSTDDTEAACLSLDDDRLHIVSQSNSGVSASRNRGVEVSRGDYVMFVDADDVLDSGWGSVVFPFLGCGEDVVVFTASAERERYGLDDLVSSIVGTGIRLDRSHDLAFVEGAMSPVSRLYSRSFLQDAGITFDTRVINGEDALFNMKAFLSTDKVRFVGRSFYRYRIHGDSATHAFNPRFFESNEVYLCSLQELLDGSNRYSSREIKRAVDYSFCRSVFLMALYAGRISDRDDRRAAQLEIADSHCVMARMSTPVDLSGNPLYERFVYKLVARGLLSVAVSALRIALAAAKREREGWKTI